MPKRTSTTIVVKRGRQKKRRRRSSYRRDPRSKYLGPSRGIYGKSTRATLKYSAIISIDAALVGLFANHTFSVNGMYDPDITGAGHQPQGFDQYMVGYEHYTVTSAKIRCEFITSATTGATNVAICALARSPEPTGITAQVDVLENPNTQTKMKHFGDNADNVVLTDTVNVAQYLGRGRVTADLALAGTSAANPSEQVYWQVGMASPYGGDPALTYVKVDILFNAIFTEPVGLTNS